MGAKTVTFGAVMLATLLAALDQSIVATALPQIVDDLEGFENLEWVVTAYLVTSTVTIPLYGKLSDVYGRRRLFLASISIFLLGSVLCGIAGSMTELIAYRALQGLGAGGLLPLAQTTVADLFSPRERGRYQGYISSMWGVAAVAGPLVGGLLTDALTWRWIFFVNLPLGGLALLVVLRTLPAHAARREHRVDFTGAALLAAAIGCLLLALSWGGTTHPWDSPQVLAAAAAGLVLLALLTVVERRAPEPVVPIGLLSDRLFAVATGAQLVLGAVVFGLTIYVPVALQAAHGDSATTSGSVLLGLTLGWVIAAPVGGRFIARTGRYRALPLVGASLTAIGATLLATLGTGGPHLLIALLLLVAGIGMGFTNPAYVVATQNAAAAGELGAATAALQFSRAMGGSIAVAGLGALLALRAGGDAGPAALTAGLHDVFWVIAAVAVAGIALARALDERPLGTRTGMQALEEQA